MRHPQSFIAARACNEWEQDSAVSSRLPECKFFLRLEASFAVSKKSSYRRLPPAYRLSTDCEHDDETMHMFWITAA